MAAPAFMSPEEYLAFERRSATKHEYVDGVVYAMAGASRRHNRAAANVLVKLTNDFGNGDCEAFISDMRVQGPTGTRYWYPDVVAVCGQPELHDDDNLLNPTLIVEVLSPSTASYDRLGKFKLYRSIPSLVHYVLVEQAYCWVECFTRQPDGRWTVVQLDTLDAILELPAVGSFIPLSDIYRRIKVGPAPQGPSSADTR